MKVKNIVSIIFAAIISFMAIYFTTSKNDFNTPVEAYRVYLDGEKIGLIKSKQELENYIDTKQESLKQN